MKKTTIYGDTENFNLYFGIKELYGEFLLETGGDPTCLGELEEEDADGWIHAVNDLLNDPATPWEPCTKEDEEYVAEWVNIWVG